MSNVQKNIIKYQGRDYLGKIPSDEIEKMVKELLQYLKEHNLSVKNLFWDEQVAALNVTAAVGGVSKALFYFLNSKTEGTVDFQSVDPRNFQ